MSIDVTLSHLYPAVLSNLHARCKIKRVNLQIISISIFAICTIFENKVE